jgi:anhydro-N-acetylmuramic acid kinase
MGLPLTTTEGAMRAIGLMSGTSMDGIDAALIESDGYSSAKQLGMATLPYPHTLRTLLLSLPRDDVNLADIEHDLTTLNVEVVRTLLSEVGADLTSVSCVGFHGQTILHDPARRVSWQLGDGRQMAAALGCAVVSKFRQNDLDNGGQGAPLAPAYHHLLARQLHEQRPVAILNIGGVSNVTLCHGEQLFACDCGPGNALIDDWMRLRCGLDFDRDGRLASQGQVDVELLNSLMDHEFFRATGPKSLDRNAFSHSTLEQLSDSDGVATLVAFTAAAIAAAAQRLPVSPCRWIVVGGGRKNNSLLLALRSALPVPVVVAEDVGWNGDAIEAEAFAYLAIRKLLDAPISWPSTTGVRAPVTGGVIHLPRPSPSQV